MSEAPPAPGSPEAVEKGCVCPMSANNHGAGIEQPNGEIAFYKVSICPLHGVKT